MVSLAVHSDNFSWRHFCFVLIVFSVRYELIFKYYLDKFCALNVRAMAHAVSRCLPFVEDQVRSKVSPCVAKVLFGENFPLSTSAFPRKCHSNNPIYTSSCWHHSGQVSKVRWMSNSPVLFHISDSSGQASIFTLFKASEYVVTTDFFSVLLYSRNNISDSVQHGQVCS